MNEDGSRQTSTGNFIRFLGDNDHAYSRHQGLHAHRASHRGGHHRHHRGHRGARPAERPPRGQRGFGHRFAPRHHSSHAGLSSTCGQRPLRDGADGPGRPAAGGRRAVTSAPTSARRIGGQERLQRDSGCRQATAWCGTAWHDACNGVAGGEPEQLVVRDGGTRPRRVDGHPLLLGRHRSARSSPTPRPSPRRPGMDDAPGGAPIQ